jgi:hypothetical protein
MFLVSAIIAGFLFSPGPLLVAATTTLALIIDSTHGERVDHFELAAINGHTRVAEQIDAPARLKLKTNFISGQPRDYAIGRHAEAVGMIHWTLDYQQPHASLEV